MKTYDKLVEDLRAITRTKHATYAKKGMGNSKVFLNNLFEQVDSVIDKCIYIDADDGDSDLLELRLQLTDLETRERSQHNPFETIIDVEQLIIPKLIDIMKRYQKEIDKTDFSIKVL